MWDPQLVEKSFNLIQISMIKHHQPIYQLNIK